MAGSAFSIRERLATDKPFVFPWVGMPGATQVGQIARMGFSGVALDLQHGMIDNGEAIKMTSAINAAGAPTVVRVLWNDPGLIGFALDMGAAAVIAPMINTVEQARALVKSAKYPPLGQRSWGGYTMVQAAGVSAGDYLREANSKILVFAMIETREALGLVNEIAAVPGLDGLFVGPSDLSIALSNGAKIDRLGPATLDAMKLVVAACKTNNLVAGAFGGSREAVRIYEDLGFQFLAGPSDTDLLKVGAEAFLKE